MSVVQKHNEHVRHFFNQTEHYLKHSFGIKIRIDIVRRFLKGKSFLKALDLGCGDGSISIALLDQLEDLTLLDISPEMLKKAKQNLPPEKESITHFMEGDYRQLQASKTQYDLVLAIGVLAHIHDSKTFLQVLQDVVSPGGYLILQFTERDHFLPRLYRMIRKHRYSINLVNKKELLQQTATAQFTLIDAQQFGLTLPGFGRLPDRFLYRYESFVLNSNSLSRLGTDHLLFFQKES